MRAVRLRLSGLAVLLGLAGLALAFTRAQGAPISACAQPRYVTALANGPQGAVYAGTQGTGLYQSRDGGHCWTPLPTYPTAIWTGIISVVPQHPSVLVAGASFEQSLEGPRTLERSADGGKTWAPIAVLPSSMRIIPEQLGASPRGTLVLSYIFLCTTDVCPRRQGLARSVDAGRSWQPVGPRIAALQRSTATILADGSFLAVQDDGHADRHVLRSLDDGRTWQPLHGRLPSMWDLATLAAIPWDTHQLVAGFGIRGLHPVVMQSTDTGAHWRTTWSAAAAGYVTAVAALPRTHTLLFSLYHPPLSPSSAHVGDIYRSINGGRTWALVDTQRGPHYVWTLLAGTDGATLYAGTKDGVYRSTDTGRTWQPNAP